MDSLQVDLAGSERIKESGSEGVRLTEAQVLFSKQSNWFDFAYFPFIVSHCPNRYAFAVEVQ